MELNGPGSTHLLRTHRPGRRLELDEHRSTAGGDTTGASVRRLAPHHPAAAGRRCGDRPRRSSARNSGAPMEPDRPRLVRRGVRNAATQHRRRRPAMGHAGQDHRRDRHSRRGGHRHRVRVMPRSVPRSVRTTRHPGCRAEHRVHLPPPPAHLVSRRPARHPPPSGVEAPPCR